MQTGVQGPKPAEGAVPLVPKMPPGTSTSRSSSASSTACPRWPLSPSSIAAWELSLAVTALVLACPSGTQPLEYEGLRDRYLPEVALRGRVEHLNSQHAMYAAACIRGGLQPD